MDTYRARKIDIAFVTAKEMPKPDEETQLLVKAVKDRGLDADVIPWDIGIDWATVPLVVVRTTWDYYKRLPEFLNWARQVNEVSQLANPYAVIEWNSHKRYLLELSLKGVPTVPTHLLEKGAVEEGKIILVNCGWSEIVIKPAVSIGAIGALRTTSGTKDSINHLESLLSESDVLVQPFVSNVLEAGEVSMIYFGSEFSHAIRKQPKPGEYRVQDHHGGTVHSHVPSAEEHEAASAALAATPTATIYARVDLVNFNKKLVVMELELIEPALFLSYSPNGAQRFADILCSLVSK